MNNQLIPVFAGEINKQSTQLVDARLLHSFLEIARDFSTWIKDRIEEYGFSINQDYLEYSPKSGKKGRPAKEYHLTLDMGKELGMVERNEKGRKIRRYFIECEKALFSNFIITPEKKTLQSKNGCLTLDQQDTIKNIVRSTAESLPKEHRAKMTIRMWSAIKNKFGCTYKEVPEQEFNNIISLLARLPIEGELLLAKPEKIEYVGVTNTENRDYNLAKKIVNNIKGSVSGDLLNDVMILDSCLNEGFTRIDEALKRLMVANDLLVKWGV